MRGSSNLLVRTEKPGFTGLFVFSEMVVVYVLKSKNHSFQYVGMTKDLETRITRHNRGGNKSTKAYAPFYLIYTKKFPDHSTARVHEKFLKSGRGRDFLNDLSSGSLSD